VSVERFQPGSCSVRAGTCHNALGSAARHDRSHYSKTLRCRLPVLDQNGEHRMLIIVRPQPRYPQIKLPLEGYWSNSFAIVARAVSALYFCGVGDREVKTFMDEAAEARCRSNLLDVVVRWVSVT
jgi:hypothetical protein